MQVAPAPGPGGSLSARNVRRRHRRRHLEIQVDIQARKLYFKVSQWLGGLVKDIREWRMEFYTEFRGAAHEHIFWPWEPIWGKSLKMKEYTLFHN